jgi:N-acetylneuraminic acid mutarotase
MKRAYALLLPLLLTALFSLCRAVSAQGCWTTVAPMPTARFGQTSATAPDGRIYVIGGHSVPYNNLLLVEVYNPSSNSWSTDSPPLRAHYQGQAVSGNDGRIYLIGGYYRDTFTEVYDPATDTWTALAPMPTGRFNFGTVVTPDGLIYAIGGDTGGGGEPTRVVEAYNPLTNTWTARASMNKPRNHFSVALGPGGRIYAFGGDSPVLNTVEVYDPQTNAWTFVDTTMPNPGSCLVVALDGLIYCLAGGTEQNEAAVYNPATNSWQSLPSLSMGHHAGTVSVSRGRIYVIGGFNLSDSTALNLTEMYAPHCGTLEGTITLSECSDSGHPVSFEFRSMNGYPSFIKTVTLANDGSFTLPDVPADMYNLAIKGSKWLRKVISVGISSNNITLAEATLQGGDANDDNSVDVLDLDLFIQAFDSRPGSGNWNPNADFNCDESVDVLDLDLLIRNFDIQGDP